MYLGGAGQLLPLVLDRTRLTDPVLSAPSAFVRAPPHGPDVSCPNASLGGGLAGPQARQPSRALTPRLSRAALPDARRPQQRAPADRGPDQTSADQHDGAPAPCLCRVGLRRTRAALLSRRRFLKRPLVPVLPPSLLQGREARDMCIRMGGVGLTHSKVEARGHIYFLAQPACGGLRISCATERMNQARPDGLAPAQSLRLMLKMVGTMSRKLDALRNANYVRLLRMKVGAWAVPALPCPCLLQPLRHRAVRPTGALPMCHLAYRRVTPPCHSRLRRASAYFAGVRPRQLLALDAPRREREDPAGGGRGVRGEAPSGRRGARAHAPEYRSHKAAEPRPPR